MLYIVRLQKEKNSQREADCLPVLADKVRIADTFCMRLKGLMFKKGLAEGEGLLLTKTKQIHTCWMRFAIDVFYLKKEGKCTYTIVGLNERMNPWRFGRLYREETDVLELNEGIIEKYDIQVGDSVKISKL